MSKDKKSLIDLVPDSIDNAVKNITDKPTQNMGTTLADIWYLVFGGISQAAEKRKLKYSYALQEFEKELKEKISKIPEDKLTEPDIQIIGHALEASKYCIEKEDLRHLFSSLIAAGINKDNYIPPVIINIVRYMSPIDCKILKYLYQIPPGQLPNLSDLKDIFSLKLIQTSLAELEQLQLIYSGQLYSGQLFYYGDITEYPWCFENIKLSFLGDLLCDLCM